MQDKENQPDVSSSGAEALRPDGDSANTADVPPSATEPSLEQQLATANANTQEMEDAFMRAKAEVENGRRRAKDDVAKAHKFAIEGFAEQLIGVRDSLEMALKVEVPSVESLRAGVEVTLKQLNAAFEKHKLMEIAPQPGDKLDPMKHHALSLVAAEQEPNTVVEVLQKGYTIADRLLRPALVTVAKGRTD
ncbi:MAG: nucleotide exchange factor GrpE [Herbaspirillum sp.]